MFKNRLPKKIKLGLKVFGMCMGMFVFLKTVDARISSNLPVSTISDEFPVSYQMYIDNLKKIYPNATFKAVYTGLEWKTVLKHECYEVNKRISLVPSSYSSVWKKDGENTYIDGNFVIASKTAVAYVLDPRNSLYEREVFQFEGLSYNSEITTSVVEKVIASSPMVGTYEKKYKNAGKWLDMDLSYSEIINKVGQEQGVSSVYIASRMIQETSGDIVNNGSINGSSSKYPGVYNFFNIGATPNSDGTGAITNGLKYAKAEGWTTPYLSISGGVNEIKSSYIKYGQDTVYFQKFDVNNPYGNASALMAYQYQTNILAPRSESRISYNAYKKLKMLDTSFIFYIPVYNNMPEDPTPYPADDTAKFVLDDTKVYLDDGIKNGSDTFNIRSSASSELDNIIYTLVENGEGSENRTILTRTKKGEGFDWDYVECVIDEKTVKGYIWNEYVNVYEYTKVENVTLDKQELTIELGEEYTLVANVLPENAKYKEVNWSVQNPEILEVANGKIIPKTVGETIVNVTTEDQKKIATCKVVVVPMTQSIVLDKQEYVININEFIEPQIELKNITGYTLEIVDTSIATVEDSKIKGISIGETVLKVKGNDTEITVEAKVIVNENIIEQPKPEEPEIPEPEVPTPGETPPEETIPEYILDSSLKLTEKIVTGVVPTTAVSSLKEKIVLKNATVIIKGNNGQELTDEQFVGTDSQIVIYNLNNEILDTLTVVILGEVTGDGKINSADLLKIVKYLKGATDINEKAADVTLDEKINSADLLKIVKFLKGTATIDFN